MTEGNEIEVKAILDPDLKEKFLKIKEVRGLKHDSEAIRFCIAQEYEVLKKMGRVE